MSNSAHFSFIAPVFNSIVFPEEVIVSGYSAIVHRLQLPVPLGKATVVSTSSKRVDNEQYRILPKIYQVDDDKLKMSKLEALYKHLVFALKYEGVNLLIISAIVKQFEEKEVTAILQIEPTGQYTRRLWFIIEWLLGKELNTIPNLSKKSYVEVLDTKIQYGIKGVKSARHMVINNLPGTTHFCPLIWKTTKLEEYISAQFAEKKENYLKGIRKNILQRASAFLLLKDSKASFTIEGESPKSKRAARWGQAIGQAGINDLNHEELKRLQQLVIENPRFLEMGYRKKGGFIGDRDSDTFSPIPDHISARFQDLEKLMNGLIETNKLLISSDIDAVLSATMIAFGFVYIHPFVDGNGRIHRYLIHHVLAKKQFSQQGIIFPVSASILDKITDYQKILETYSIPLLDFIEWQETSDHNVEVLNETIDYYRFFDCTKQAEFLYECVKETIEKIIPEQVEYLQKYEEFKTYVDNTFEMPDDMLALLVRFLEQNNGILSKRAKEKEFSALTDVEVQEIELNYKNIFLEV